MWDALAHFGHNSDGSWTNRVAGRVSDSAEQKSTKQISLKSEVLSLHSGFRSLGVANSCMSATGRRPSSESFAARLSSADHVLSMFRLFGAGPGPTMSEPVDDLHHLYGAAWEMVPQQLLDRDLLELLPRGEILRQSQREHRARSRRRPIQGRLLVRAGLLLLWTCAAVPCVAC